MTAEAQQLQDSVDNLRKVSKLIYKSHQDHEFLVQRLNEITPQGRKSLLDKYKNADGPVTLIRKQVAEILSVRDITLSELQKITDEAKAENPKSFSRMYVEWYNILYMFIISNYKDSIEQSITTIKNNVSSSLGNPDYLSSVSYDFSGERQTGSTRLWIAFYNISHKNQSTAKQLFILIENGFLLYSFYDRPINKHTGRRDIQEGTIYDADEMMSFFQSHLKDIEANNNNPVSIIKLEKGQQVFKISMGPKDVTEEVYQYLLSDNLVTVNKNTNALGTTSDKQGDEFTKSMKIGDYFYLCRGNRMVLLGRITSDIEDVEFEGWADDGWVQRSFDKLYDAVSDEKYQEAQKWWAPNFRSTCWPVPESEITFANDKLFRPFFQAEFIIPENVDPKTSEENKIESMKALNTILYGPPGTGKTFRMMEHIRSMDVIETIPSDKPDYEGFVQSKSWWELIALVLFEGDAAAVPEILEHELIKTKLRISDIQFPPQRVWSTLQTHAVLDCPNVKTNPAKRHGDLIFYKETNSMWRLNDKNDFTEQFSFLIEQFASLNAAEEMVKTRKHFTFTTCHQSLSYEDFIEGIKPVLVNPDLEEDNTVQYEIRKGYFYQACEKAVQRAGYSNFAETLHDTKENRETKFNEAIKNNHIYVLFLDEINRCNISAVFGELITLIEDDKRLGAKNEIADTLLPYSQTFFGVPSNLFIIGTMNTADRSVEALDTALRRRFSFEFMPPDEKCVAVDFSGLPLQNIFNQINERISFLLDKDHQIGHSYFMKLSGLNELRDVFKHKIIPLLKEYFFNDYRKIHLILGDGFVKKDNYKPIFAVNDNEEMARDIYTIIPINDNFKIKEALMQTFAK